ncbi:MAG: NAD(P)H-dependent oxidoreductase subunit E [Nanoarchaeota archaeon]|nr:NAD(P)H-dependent oxidoreductase subunit E [Nanoarchaeota archaeon]
MKDLLLPMLVREQKKQGFLSEAALKKVADKTRIPISQVYGVSTFYSFLHTTKQGKYTIYICNSPSCHVNGSMDLIRYLKKKLKMKLNTTKGKFSLYQTSCIGCCDEAPAMLLNGKAHTNLTKEKIDKILKKCK